MNLQQLEYIVAVDTHQHFGRAAASCFVTQPTLSMMIQKLEDEIGTKVFDRSKKPVIPTEKGVAIIQQARVILREIDRMQTILRQQKNSIEGQLTIGIIPTLAPYLLPFFLGSMLQKYPGLQVNLMELTTEALLQRLMKGQIDVGILVTPLYNKLVHETPLFYEEFFVYASNTFDKQYLLPKDIDPKGLWLLEEGHCFRSQIINLCELRQKSNGQLQYEAGSLETLIKLVDHQEGTTILPELATRFLTETQRKKLHAFLAPAPVREVSLVRHRDDLKRDLLEILQKEILEGLPKEILEKKEMDRVEI